MAHRGCRTEWAIVLFDKTITYNQHCRRRVTAYSACWFRNKQMEGIMKLRQLLLACLMLSCTSVLAEDAYYHVPLASLTLSEGKLPASFEWGDSAWEMVEAVQPYAVLDGDGEAYVGGQSLQPGNPSDRAFQNMFLAIRAPNGGAPTGRLFVPK